MLNSWSKYSRCLDLAESTLEAQPQGYTSEDYCRRHFDMTWYGRVGEIQETFRSEFGVSFRWKIPHICSMPKKVGGVYYSPELQFLDSVWYLGICPNGEVVHRDWIGLEIWRSHANPLQKPVLLSLGIVTADGSEEQIHSDERYPEKCRFFFESKFLLRSELLSRASEIAPSETLTVSCSLWGDGPSSDSGTGDWFFVPKSQTDDQTDSDAVEEEYPLRDLEVETPVAREAQAEDVEDTGAGLEESTHSTIEGKTLVSCETQTEDANSSSSKEGSVDLDKDKKENKTLVSREIQTESGSNASGRDDELEVLDTEGISILRKHFEDLLLSGDDHDVLFKVKDREFKAHKNVLRARSPVFAGIFQNKIESTDGSIAIADCDPEAFGEFLHYIYTGVVQNLSASNAVGLYYAGDKYDFSRLKVTCIQFLKDSLSITTICDIITLATKHGEEELLQRAMAFFSEHLEEIMTTDEWQRFLTTNPIQANEICLKAVKSLKASYLKTE